VSDLGFNDLVLKVKSSSFPQVWKTGNGVLLFNTPSLELEIANLIASPC